MANQISQELSFSNAVSINDFVLIVFYLKLKIRFCPENSIVIFFMKSNTNHKFARGQNNIN
jgi:hypothetical protein